uniref:Uncharacterized protein n=1 Tax=Alexandrium monilatum TaxID=311494 RepID=A0A7S4PZR8_9DINO|mmetsp:Transcript_14623/g.43687  ORF Transcript_14623/g.43687 Transcript_14623/m.43687 type:complete len:316 (-) Transcript_14623:64-1011(-)
MTLAVGAWRLLLLVFLPALLQPAAGRRYAVAATAAADTPVLDGAPPQVKGSLRGRSVEDFIHGLEANVRRVLGHLRADRSLSGEEARQRDRVAGLLDGALASQGGVFLHAMALHQALWAAQGFLLRRTKELTQQHTHLSDEVEEQQAHILYAMLKQRRRLPMSSQVALLRREQFANSPYAQQLLKRHLAAKPLYRQLESLLPAPLAHELMGQQPRAAEHLAAGGSEGRVHIVSSRLKNDVKKMEGELRHSRDLISQLLAQGSVQSEAERKQAKGALADLDGVLRKVGGTNDLKVQLEAMYEVQGKMAKWMKGFAV